MHFLLACLLTPLVLAAAPPPSDVRLQMLYHGLDPYSIAEKFTFYSLYPTTLEGKKAMSDAWQLMNKHRPKNSQLRGNLAVPDVDLHTILSLINRQKTEPSILLKEQELSLIEYISDHLYNRKLKGFRVWDRTDVLALHTEEIDLARAILINQFEHAQDKNFQIRQCEAILDLMTLQIMARLPKNPSNEEKIQAINHFIFYEKKFRFPPHSIWSRDIDLYTFLPSVLDSRMGVCLGVSILYLSIGQRMNLPLEIITPPGHIYIRHQAAEKTINIETTARGTSLPSKTYLSLNTHKLQKRQLKEVVGLVLINQASSAWHNEEYEKAVALYEQAFPFIQNDSWLKTLLGYAYLFAGKIKHGKALLEEVCHDPCDFSVYKQVTPEDYLNDCTDIEGIKAIFLHVDETYQSILNKQRRIQKILEKYPTFRDGLLHLAISQIQLSQIGDALATLRNYHEIDPNNPEVEYYLAFVYFDRICYRKAWEHLKNAEKMTKIRGYFPDALKSLRHQLRRLYPDPADESSP